MIIENIVADTVQALKHLIHYSAQCMNVKTQLLCFKRILIMILNAFIRSFLWNKRYEIPLDTIKTEFMLNYKYHKNRFQIEYSFIEVSFTKVIPK